MSTTHDISTAQAVFPTIYIPHGGGPWPFMDWHPRDAWSGLERYLRGLDAAIGRRPKAVLVVSAHWEERLPTIQATARPELIFDYSGFPAHTYELAYPAPGSPGLARRAAELMAAAGLEVRQDDRRGYDHGTFVPFMLIYPQADVPLVQLSLLRNLDPAAHIAVGKALQPLRQEGVLIIGSGMSYHNLRGFGSPQPDSYVFDDWLTKAVESADAEHRNALLRQWSAAPAGRSSHPREEHLLPLMVVAGAAGQDVGRRTFKDVIFGTAYSGFQFGS